MTDAWGIGKLQPSRPRAIKIVAGDIETNGLGGPYILGATYDGLRVRYFNDPVSLLNSFLIRENTGYTLAFHNADYDLRYILPILQEKISEKYSCHIIVNGQKRTIQITIRRSNCIWYIADTYALIPAPLKKLAPLAGMEKLDIGLAKGVIFDPLNSEHLEYLDRDVRMLYHAYRNFIEIFYKTYNVFPGITSASSAMRAWRTTIEDHHYYSRLNKRDEQLARAAYYGGRVFFRQYNMVDNCTLIDANAMYAASMLRGVPVGNAVRTAKERRDYPGIYNCYVKCNVIETPFTFIPYRFPHNKRVAWPIGEFPTTLTSNSIELARLHGYEIEVINGVVFPEGIQPIFNSFLGNCQELENQFRGEGLADIVKILRNGLYGKFAQKPEAREYYLNEEIGPGCILVHDEQGGIVPGLYYKNVMMERPYMLPHFAAWITAGARNILAEAIYAIGPYDCFYGDTDSIVVSNEALTRAIEEKRITIGSQYGEWKIAKKYRSFRAIASKLYAGIMEDGSINAAHKGIKADDFDTSSLLHIEEVLQYDPKKKEMNLPIATVNLPHAIRTIAGQPFNKPITKRIKPLPDQQTITHDKETNKIEPVVIHI